MASARRAAAVVAVAAPPLTEPLPSLLSVELDMLGTSSSNQDAL